MRACVRACVCVCAVCVLCVCVCVCVCCVCVRARACVVCVGWSVVAKTDLLHKHYILYYNTERQFSHRRKVHLFFLFVCFCCCFFDSVRACVRACVRECVSARERMRAYVCLRTRARARVCLCLCLSVPLFCPAASCSVTHCWEPPNGRGGGTSVGDTRRDGGTSVGDKGRGGGTSVGDTGRGGGDGQ